MATVIAMSLKAWAPVFDSMQQVFGEEIFTRLIGDWTEYQSGSVEATLTDKSMHVWVVELDGALSGFVSAKVVDAKSAVGEITMLAVDPRAQGRGLGLRLTEVATNWLRDSGVRVAMVETGGDNGHAVARHLYEKAGYTLSPVARYFKAL